jgi:aspartate racemase
MGPLATADFLRELTRQTPALRDQDHFRVLVYSNPHVPDRSSAILGEGESPLPALLSGLEFLERGGVDVVAIPCNASHFWIGDLRSASAAPIIDIVEAVRDALVRHGVEGPVGVLATRGTIQSGIYNRRLSAAGFRVVEPSPEEQGAFVDASIRSVKAGRLEEGRRLALQALECLERRGAAAVVLGCTEFPIVLTEAATVHGSPIVNSTVAQARACVEWARARGSLEAKHGAEQSETLN